MQNTKIQKEFIKTFPQMEKIIDDKGKEKVPSSFEVAIFIIENCDSRLISTGGKFYIYDKGTYHEIGSTTKTKYVLKQLILKVLDEEHIKASFIDGVIRELNTYYHELTPLNDANKTFINMKSNVLVISNDGKVESQEHNKKFNFQYQLAYDYDPEAEAPIFENFLKTSIEDESLINIIFEYLAYVLIKDTKNFEKALFLYGSGSNGKSTLLNIIKELFGKSNISYVEITQMGDKQECALMDGKLLNISSDAKKNGLDTSAFKKIVSGEPILGKYLFKDIYTIENLPKLIVAMNKLPFHNGDNTHGFYRRLLLIPFNKTIREEDKDYNLERKVIEGELSGVFNLIIKGLLRLNTQKGFSKSNVMNEMTNQYIKSTNHVPTFIEEEGYEVVPDATKTGTSLKDLYSNFKAWCNEYGYNPHSANYLATELDQLGYKAYKNSIKHYRLIKTKMTKETSFTTLKSVNPYGN